MRLDKYLADMGIGTRSDLKKAICSGAVSVNGQLAHRLLAPGKHVAKRYLARLDRPLLRSQKGAITR